MPKRDSNRRVRSVYFDEREFEALNAVALANGQSANALTRIAVRQLLGLPSPTITISDELRDRFRLVAT